MALLAISVAPSGGATTSLSAQVAPALDVLKADERVRYEIGPMFTTVEGEIGDLFDVARKMHEALAEAGAERIGTVIKIDDRRDKPMTMKGKVDSVREKMQQG